MTKHFSSFSWRHPSNRIIFLLIRFTFYAKEQRITESWTGVQSTYSLKAHKLSSFLHVTCAVDTWPASPCCPRFQLLHFGAGCKAWGRAKAQLWGRGLGLKAAQMSESGRGASAGTMALWESLLFVPPALMWTLELVLIVVADISWARLGLHQKDLELWERLTERLGRKGQRTRCGPGALAAAGVPVRFHWWRSAVRSAAGWPMLPLEFLLVCTPVEGPPHGALCKRRQKRHNWHIWNTGFIKCEAGSQLMFGFYILHIFKGSYKLIQFYKQVAA